MPDSGSSSAQLLHQLRIAPGAETQFRPTASTTAALRSCCAPAVCSAVPHGVTVRQHCKGHQHKRHPARSASAHESLRPAHRPRRSGSRRKKFRAQRIKPLPQQDTSAPPGPIFGYPVRGQRSANTAAPVSPSGPLLPAASLHLPAAPSRAAARRHKRGRPKVLVLMASAPAARYARCTAKMPSGRSGLPARTLAPALLYNRYPGYRHRTAAAAGLQVLRTSNIDTFPFPIKKTSFFSLS